MKRSFKIGQKVVPVSKKPRIRDDDNCGTYYARYETGQPFLYVVGFDEEEEARFGVPCYWCNVSKHIGGDSFADSDLVLYTGE